MSHDSHPRFPVGRVLATPGALVTLALAGLTPWVLLDRHVRGDWGDLPAADQHTNDQALHQGGRLLSAYGLPTGDHLWIITEADRSVTTLLRPDEY